MDERDLILKVLEKAVKLRDEEGKLTHAEVFFILNFFSLHGITELDLTPWESRKYKDIIENLQREGLVKTEWAYHSVGDKKKRVFRVKLVEPQEPQKQEPPKSVFRKVFERIFRR
ncbi:MAG: hypothetical protein JHC30_08280 [Caldisericum sp.]|jgi:hypothetical protein|nr:hypothetical protein [Caldisericum sp.]